MNRDKLKGKIAEQGMTRKSVAAAMGITPQALGKKLNGQTKFTVSDAEKLCSILGIYNHVERCEIFLSLPSHN